MTLVITISNQSTPHGYFSIAECDGLIVRKSKGGVITKLARLLQEKGHKRETPVIVQRDGLQVFRKKPLHQWADFEIYEPDARPMRLARWDYEAAKKRAEQFEDA